MSKFTSLFGALVILSGCISAEVVNDYECDAVGLFQLAVTSRTNRGDPEGAAASKTASPQESADDSGSAEGVGSTEGATSTEATQSQKAADNSGSGGGAGDTDGAAASKTAPSKETPDKSGDADLADKAKELMSDPELLKDPEKLKGKTSDLIEELMKDPELKKMIDENPKLKDIMTEVKEDPMAGLKYMNDPEVAPFVQKAMSKMQAHPLPAAASKAASTPTPETPEAGTTSDVTEVSAETPNVPSTDPVAADIPKATPQSQASTGDTVADVPGETKEAKAASIVPHASDITAPNTPGSSVTPAVAPKAPKVAGTKVEVEAVAKDTAAPEVPPVTEKPEVKQTTTTAESPAVPKDHEKPEAKAGKTDNPAEPAKSAQSSTCALGLQMVVIFVSLVAFIA